MNYLEAREKLQEECKVIKYDEVGVKIGETEPDRGIKEVADVAENSHKQQLKTKKKRRRKSAQK
jgi:hypothetical protein